MLVLHLRTLRSTICRATVSDAPSAWEQEIQPYALLRSNRKSCREYATVYTAEARRCKRLPLQRSARSSLECSWYSKVDKVLFSPSPTSGCILYSSAQGLTFACYFCFRSSFFPVWGVLSARSPNRFGLYHTPLRPLKGGDSSTGGKSALKVGRGNFHEETRVSNRSENKRATVQVQDKHSYRVLFWSRLLLCPRNAAFCTVHQGVLE